MAAVCSGTMHTWEGKLIQIVVACLWYTEMHFPPKKCCLILEIRKLKLEVAAIRINANIKWNNLSCLRQPMQAQNFTKYAIWRLKTYRKQWRNKWLLYFQPELKTLPSFAQTSKLFFYILSMNLIPYYNYNKVYNKAIIQSIGLRKIVAHKQILEQFVLSNGLPWWITRFRHISLRGETFCCIWKITVLQKTFSQRL